MSECEATTRMWKDKTQYVCEACNIRTLSPDVLASRCRITATPPPVMSSLLGPDGEPAVLEPAHVGGGVYELPSGERIRGKDAAREAMGQPTSHDDE